MVLRRIPGIVAGALGGLALLVAVVPFVAAVEGPPAARTRTYDLRDVRLELRFDEREASFEGHVVNTIVPLDPSLPVAEFDCVGLEVNGVSLEGRELEHEIDGKRLRVTIGEAAAREGRPLPIRIDYRGKDPSRGLYFIRPDERRPGRPYQIWSQGESEDTRYWVPTYDAPDDLATFEAILTVHRPLIAVSNGILIGVTEDPNGPWRTYRYRSEQPFATYLIAVAIGDWEKYTDEVDRIPLEYYVQRGVGEATARRSFGGTPDMMRFFAEKIGVPYPYGKYAQVCVRDFVAGGMENAACTLLTDRTLHDERSDLERTSDGLVSHELAHMWFGDLVTCRDWSDLWLNEGFATYFAALYTRHHLGEDAFRFEIRRQQRGYLRAQDRSPAPMVAPVWDREGAGRASSNVYTQGASVLYMLHGILGEDLFWKGIRHYLEEHAFGNADTHDLSVAIREATGRDLEWFFQQWTRSVGHPAFEVRHEYDEATGTSVLAVKQTQKTGEGVPIFRVPVTIEITTDASKLTRRVWCDEAEERFEFRVPGPPRMVRFDKENRIPKTLKFEKTTAELLYQLVSDDDVIGRDRAARALGDQPGAGVVEALGRRLGEEPYQGVRGDIVRSLAKLGGEEAVGPILAALGAGTGAGKGDPDARVRRAAASALGSLEGEGVDAALGRALGGDPAYGVRAEACKALAERAVARRNPGGAFDILAHALDAPSERDTVAAAAVEALAGLDDPRVPDLLLERLGSGGSPALRRALISALGECCGNEAFADRKPRIAEALLPLLTTERGFGRFALVRALAATDDPRALEALEGLDVKGRFSGMVKRAVEGLRKRIGGGAGEKETGAEEAGEAVHPPAAGGGGGR